MNDPIYMLWIVVTPIISAIVLGIIANRARYKDEVQDCIKWAKQYKKER